VEGGRRRDGARQRSVTVTLDFRVEKTARLLIRVMGIHAVDHAAAMTELFDHPRDEERRTFWDAVTRRVEQLRWSGWRASAAASGDAAALDPGFD
jgi:hypothetical protein